MDNEKIKGLCSVLEDNIIQTLREFPQELNYQEILWALDFIYTNIMNQAFKGNIKHMDRFLNERKDHIIGFLVDQKTGERHEH